MNADLASDGETRDEFFELRPVRGAPDFDVHKHRRSGDWKIRVMCDAKRHDQALIGGGVNSRGVGDATSERHEILVLHSNLIVR